MSLKIANKRLNKSFEILKSLISNLRRPSMTLTHDPKQIVMASQVVILERQKMEQHLIPNCRDTSCQANAMSPAEEANE